jgi:LAO/AO transport system kinase
VKKTSEAASIPTQTRGRLSAREYVAGILGGNKTVLARAITLVESGLPEDAELAAQVLEECLPSSGNSVRLGITGSPGVGKSTFIEALGTHLTRERAETVAVLSVDPTSSLSGGSILGDKTRMEKLATDDRAFIRPSPTRGALGGVTRNTREAMLLCEAAGFRNVFVETVGVGQSETTVRSMVDFFLLLILPGAGDELQGMKRGIVEMADLIAITKADGDDTKKAERTQREYRSALHLFPTGADGWSPGVVTCSALARKGIPEIWEIALRHRAEMQASGWFVRRRSQQALEWLKEALLGGLENEFLRDPQVRERLEAVKQDVLAGRVSSFRAARDLLALFRRKGS